MDCTATTAPLAPEDGDLEEWTSLGEFLREHDPDGFLALLMAADRAAAATFVTGRSSVTAREG